VSNDTRRKPHNTLWTRDFTIISIGSFISMCGNTIISFALGLLVLDYTKSVFLYAIYMITYTLPMIIMPVIAGPFLDKFSRRKVMYTLDFLSALLFVLSSLLLWNDFFNYPLLIIGCLLLGSIDSIYKVSYDSFYPLLITEGNYQKAYSIGSTIESLTALMIPVSAILYNIIGIVPLFMVNAVSFFIVAVAETQIKVREEYSEEDIVDLREVDKPEHIEECKEADKDVDGATFIEINREVERSEYREVCKDVSKEVKHEAFTRKQYIRDLKDGIMYLKEEKGLLAIAVYYFFSSVSGGASKVIELPFFKANYISGEYIYMYVWGFALLGRIIGGALQYRLNIPSQKKFKVAILVYMIISVLGGIYLFLPLHIMMTMCFIIGFSGVISYNIRVSSTQSYVPNQKKGRFNGAFHFLETSGILLGELLSGVMVNWINDRVVLFIFMSITFLSVIVIMGSHKIKVAAIYNRTS